jgi:hypothetical protein
VGKEPLSADNYVFLNGNYLLADRNAPLPTDKDASSTGNESFPARNEFFPARTIKLPLRIGHLPAGKRCSSNGNWAFSVWKPYSLRSQFVTLDVWLASGALKLEVTICDLKMGSIGSSPCNLRSQFGFETNPFPVSKIIRLFFIFLHGHKYIINIRKLLVVPDFQLFNLFGQFIIMHAYFPQGNKSPNNGDVHLYGPFTL